jgi:hypothetical protein
MEGKEETPFSFPPILAVFRSHFVSHLLVSTNRDSLNPPRRCHLPKPFSPGFSVALSPGKGSQRKTTALGEGFASFPPFLSPP